MPWPRLDPASLPTRLSQRGYCRHRAFQDTVSAGLATGSMTSFTYDIVSPEARGTIQAFRRSIGELGAFSGPILGGLIAGATSAGVAFLAFAPLHLASALLVMFVARETLGQDRRTAARPATSDDVPSASTART